jgi:hypothetical protein
MKKRPKRLREATETGIGTTGKSTATVTDRVYSDAFASYFISLLTHCYTLSHSHFVPHKQGQRR